MDVKRSTIQDYLREKVSRKSKSADGFSADKVLQDERFVLFLHKYDTPAESDEVIKARHDKFVLIESMSEEVIGRWVKDLEDQTGVEVDEAGREKLKDVFEVWAHDKEASALKDLQVAFETLTKNHEAIKKGQAALREHREKKQRVEALNSLPDARTVFSYSETDADKINRFQALHGEIGKFRRERSEAMAAAKSGEEAEKTHREGKAAIAEMRAKIFATLDKSEAVRETIKKAISSELKKKLGVTDLKVFGEDNAKAMDGEKLADVRQYLLGLLEKNQLKIDDVEVKALLKIINSQVESKAKDEFAGELKAAGTLAKFKAVVQAATKKYEIGGLAGQSVIDFIVRTIKELAKDTTVPAGTRTLATRYLRDIK